MRPRPPSTNYIQRRMQLPFFANARSIRNAIDRARMRQANRLFNRMGRRSHQAGSDHDRGRGHHRQPGVPGEVEGLDPSQPLT